MKKGERRIRVAVMDKKTGEKIGEKDIYERNIFSGSGAFNMSWQDRNKLPRENSKRQQLLREKKKNHANFETASK